MAQSLPNKMLHYQNYRLTLTSSFFQRHFFKQLSQRYGRCKKKPQYLKLQNSSRNLPGNVFFGFKSKPPRIAGSYHNPEFSRIGVPAPKSWVVQSQEELEMLRLWGRGVEGPFGNCFLPLAFENHRAPGWG